MCTYTHTTHTQHTHTHTPHGQSFTHRYGINLFPNCPPTYKHKTAFSSHPIHHMFHFVSKFVFLLEPLLFRNCLVFQCAHLCLHTHTHHTPALPYTLQPQSHVYCLCKFVFPCSGNYQQVFLLPFALLNIGISRMLMHTHSHMHRHKPTCTHTHMHMHTHSCTHTLEYASITNICAYARIKIVLAVIHHTTHTHTHTCKFVFELLSVVICCYVHI